MRYKVGLLKIWKERLVDNDNRYTPTTSKRVRKKWKRERTYRNSIIRAKRLLE